MNRHSQKAPKRCPDDKTKTKGYPDLTEILLTTISDGNIAGCKISSFKKQQLMGFIGSFAAEAKLKTAAKERIVPEDEYKIPKKVNPKKILWKYATEIITPPINVAIEKEILKKTRNKKLQKKWPEVFDNLIKEVRSDFFDIVHTTGVICTIKPGEEDEAQHTSIPTYKNLARTENYPNYLTNRAHLEKRLLTTRPQIRNVLEYCTRDIPQSLINPASFQDKVHAFEDLKQVLEEQIEKAQEAVRLWYKGIPDLKSRECDLHGAASKLVSVYLTNLLQKTIEDLIGIEGLRLEMRLELDELQLAIRPTQEEVCRLYDDCAAKIANLATGLSVLSRDRVKKQLPIYITEEDIGRYRKQVRERFERLYGDAEEHVGRLNQDLERLFEKREMQEEISFDTGCRTFEFYREAVGTVGLMLDQETFPSGVVLQAAAKEQLQDLIQLLIDAVAEKLLMQHRWENDDICETFESLKLRALALPPMSEALMELGDYMVWANTVLMNELKERIAEGIQRIYQLAHMVAFPEEVLKQNAQTIAWLLEIKPVLEQSASMFEQVKFEFEERLQKCIESVGVDIRKIYPELKIVNHMRDCDYARDYARHMSRLLHAIKEIDGKLRFIYAEEETFKIGHSEYPELSDLKDFLYPFFQLIKVCSNWKRSFGAWMDGPFEFLDFSQAEAKVDEYFKDLQKAKKTYKKMLRKRPAADDPLQFSGNPDDPDDNYHPSPIRLIDKCLGQIRDFRPNLTMMSIMCNDALLQRHWDEMSEVAGFDMTPNAGTTLRKIMNYGILDEIDKYEVISASAVKERQILTNLTKMQEEWEHVLFKTSTYKDTGINIVSQLDDIQAILEDHIIKTLSMKGSVFVKPYQAQVQEWYEKITRINDTLEEWGKVQAQWLYLLPIFSSKDIVAQMPNEGTLFKEVDGTYRRYMQTVEKEPRVILTAGQIGLLEKLQMCTDLLDQINDGVAAYLERKRLVFPRFFFLSNDEMLEILSETKDPLRVQPHLRKCFEGISRLLFDDRLQIHGMYSEEKEYIEFLSLINTEEARGSVEKWLVLVEWQMILSVKEQILRSHESYPELERTEWVQQWPGQVVLAVSQIYWTRNVHAALCSKKPVDAIGAFLNSLISDLTKTVMVIRSPKLTNLARITIKALIVIDVHAKDVVQELFTKRVRSDTEFKWLAQLRYYWEDEECLVRIINATVRYAYEYLGNSDRLVITPLTDRCYRTLIGAYYLHLNGAPEGPAGTGKTETTKDLAKAIAVQCVVFNCSDGLDYKAMGKFFKGLASSGAWACFDEFNRIEVEVLSVVAQQILCIVLAIRAKVDKFVFEGTELRLNSACYVCITMNPGYAGRSELPDNLKVLFRTVAMMVPDYAMIGEISLYSYGFVDARKLSIKIVTVYRLCSEQLSSQNHYDYGMRAVKTVLSACGNNKRKFPDENEDILLLRSIIDVNLPKFLNQDVPLFEGIISDLFPGVELPQADYDVFIAAIRECAKRRNLQPRDSFIEKIIQTYEMMVVRHGFMLVGETFAGKTSTLKVLADTLTLLCEQAQPQLNVKYQFINPKAITMAQLYGAFDPVSYEWTDGVVATCFRDFVMDPDPDRKWIIFDGPVDAVWIENMNTVLDDNKKLCLMSGEVMAMTNVMSMIFEVMDLAQASPATVSRCGMIYMEPATLGWRPFVESWIPKCNPEWCGESTRSRIIDVFNWVVDPCLYFIHKHCKQLCIVGDISLVLNFMSMLEMQLDDAVDDPSRREEDVKHLNGWIQAAFLLAGVWGLGSALDVASRERFDEFYKNLWRGVDEDNPPPEGLDKLDIPIPSDGLLFDFLFVFRMRGNWKYWPEMAEGMRVEEAPNIQQVLVPTVDTVKYLSIADQHIRHKKQVLLIGPTGTGKSYYLQDLLMNKVDQETIIPAFITFTVQITAKQTQELVISKLHKKRRGKYGAPKGKMCVIFIDDVNMPVKEVYGAQPPIELLRQYFDHKNWYDLKDTTPIYMSNVLFIAAMGPVGGSRQEVYPRFLRHFSIFSINEFAQESMSKIFTNILLLGLRNNGFASDVIMICKQLVEATLDVYNSAVLNLRPTPAKSHYVFNLRDFARIVFGCAMLRQECAEDKKTFPRIWVHEILRVFYDRLIDPVDRAWLFQKLKETVPVYFRESFEKIFERFRNEDGKVTEEALSELMFGKYFDVDASEEDQRYEEIFSVEQFREVGMAFLNEYNATHKAKMDVVLFKYALEHLSRILRVISMPAGSALLVGMSGSGRQSLTKLATTIMSHSFFTPEITKSYAMNEWRDDIKKVLKETGGRGKHMVFLFTEGQIKEEGFLPDIDGLLNSGEVPNIFQIDEKQEIMDMVRLAAQGGNRKIDIGPLALLQYFTKRCKEKLHMILCFSPIGASFRTRLRLYPALVNCCTIDWFEDWPKDALEKTRPVERPRRFDSGPLAS